VGGATLGGSVCTDAHAIVVGRRLEGPVCGRALASAPLRRQGAFVLLALPPQGWLVVALFAVAVGWMANLYNFMDGADGMAGGMALIGFSVYALAAAVGGAPAFALVNLCVAAAALGFLVFNFPPARVFMGDAGSIPLGFLAGALGLQGWAQDLWPLWFPLVVFGRSSPTPA